LNQALLDLEKEKEKTADALRQLAEEALRAEKMIADLRKKLLDLQQILKRKGHGKLAQLSIEEAGLDDFLNCRDVFERLYKDAMHRMRRLAEAQVQKLVETADEVNRACEAMYTPLIGEGRGLGIPASMPPGNVIYKGASLAQQHSTLAALLDPSLDAPSLLVRPVSGQQASGGTRPVSQSSRHRSRPGSAAEGVSCFGHAPLQVIRLGPARAEKRDLPDRAAGGMAEVKLDAGYTTSPGRPSLPPLECHGQPMHAPLVAPGGLHSRTEVAPEGCVASTKAGANARGASVSRLVGHSSSPPADARAHFTVTVPGIQPLAISSYCEQPPPSAGAGDGPAQDATVTSLVAASRGRLRGSNSLLAPPTTALSVQAAAGPAPVVAGAATLDSSPTPKPRPNPGVYRISAPQRQPLRGSGSSSMPHLGLDRAVVQNLSQ